MFLKLWVCSSWLILLATCSHRPAAVWEWSEDNGDKPGVGLRFLVSETGSTGRFYLLNPQKPHDLSAALQVVPLTDLNIRDRTMTFTVILASDKGPYTERGTIQLDDDLTGATGTEVAGTWLTAGPPSSPTRVVLKRAAE